MRKACVFTTEQELAWGRTINEYRIHVKKNLFTVKDFQHWMEYSDKNVEKIPTGKSYMTQYVKRGFLENAGNGWYRFSDNGTKPVMGRDVVVCIKLAREANNKATRRWQEKKRQNKKSQDNPVDEVPLVEAVPVVYDKKEECIKYLKSLGYKIFAPRLEYDEVF